MVRLAPSDVHFVNTGQPNSRSVAAKARQVPLIRHLPPGFECPLLGVRNLPHEGRNGGGQKSCKGLFR